MPQFDEQACANTAFAFAALNLWHRPLLNAIAAKAITLIAEEEEAPSWDPGAPPRCQFRHLLDTLGQVVEWDTALEKRSSR